MQNRIPEWSKHLSVYEVNIRQYTPEGTLKAFEAHLPRLKKLGVGILWIMPVQPIGQEKRKGSLGSNYSISDYVAVNPDFGTLDDFKRLVNKIHDMGMYVILDWVANHTAWDHRWKEEHPDFYTKDAHGQFQSPNTDWSDVMELDYSNEELRVVMIESMKFWLRETQIDGFRCDMAHLVPTNFWEQARNELDQLQPNFMLAETDQWDLLNKAFSVAYNWNLYHLGNRIARQESTVADLDEMVQHEVLNYPAHANQLLFTSNHDENTWEGSAPERLGHALETIGLLMFTLDGVPLIYSGQEAGLNKSLKFFERDPIEWKADKMFEFYRRLNELKRKQPAIWSRPYGGQFQRINTSRDSHIFAFARIKDHHRVLVLLNLSYETVSFSLDVGFLQGNYREVFTDDKAFMEGQTPFKLPSWKYRCFETSEDYVI